MNDKCKKWYPINSIIIEDIIPELRYIGGGVSEDMLVDTKQEALIICVEYLEKRILSAQEIIAKYKEEIIKESPWTLASEDLPTKDGDYLVRGSKGVAIDFYETSDGIIDEWNGWSYTMTTDIQMWMPVPKWMKI